MFAIVTVATTGGTPRLCRHAARCIEARCSFLPASTIPSLPPCLTRGPRTCADKLNAWAVVGEPPKYDPDGRPEWMSHRSSQRMHFSRRDRSEERRVGKECM